MTMIQTMMIKKSWFLVFAALAGCNCGSNCGGEPAAAVSNQASDTVVVANAPAEATTIADDGWGTIKGRIVLENEPAAAKEITVSADQGHCLAKGKLFDQTWIVNKDKAVKNAFIWLASDGKTASGKDLKVHPSLAKLVSDKVEIDQPCCAFEPRCVAVREGQSLVVKNSSPVTHNVRWEPVDKLKNKAGNETIVAGRDVVIAGLKQEKFAIGVACSIHPWMKGQVRVFDSPYYAITGDDGSFEIKLAPAGKCRLFVWHEGCGWKDGAKGKEGQEIDIPPGGTLDLGLLKLKQPQ